MNATPTDDSGLHKTATFDAARIQSEMDMALIRAKERIKEMDDSIERSRQHKKEQSVVHGNINNVNFGMSFERIVVYICLTIIAVVWLSL